ncbi:MAG: Hcp family type VI secretion system effector [Acidobacteriota bacterium]
MPIYFKYGDIKGDVKEPAHRGWIELTSMQWGVGRAITTPAGASRERSAPSVSEIVVTKPMDSASTHLFRESLDGKGVDVVIDFVKDGTVYLQVNLSNTLIASYSISGRGRNSMESLSLNFTKIEFKHTQMGD